MKSVASQLHKTQLAKKPDITSSSNLSDDIKGNTLKAVNLLIKRFLASVEDPNKPIEIHDTKELKDTISVFEAIEELSDEADTRTPQINADAVNFISSQFKEPKTAEGADNSVNNKLPKLSQKQVKKLFINREKSLDKHNTKTM